MHFPKYWALGTSGDFSCWQWSDTSQLDAQSRADASAAKLAAARENSTSRMNRYDYGQRAMREPIIEELPGVEKEDRAVITRNSYGALVLNTTRVCFVDIDFPEVQEKSKSLWAALFGKGDSKSLDSGAAASERIHAWFNRNPAWGGRLYRTKGGMRLLITSHLLDPLSSETEQIFGQLGSDPLYYRLCKNQESFRARLTPKPWRCGNSLPPVRWPFRSDDQQRKFAEWEEAYKSDSAGCATCSFVTAPGNPSVLPGVQRIIDRHDALTGAQSARELA